ncbi:MAG: thioredoxin fold domain-containing protein [Chitinophagaceae bacterium]|uniref:thioredoxin domain-containing protein n=1 Tax=unclassified Paraflavitalea TaxID=2798305 RepID=UPI003D34DFDF|nr:thioredoxin fold domain-containing protein [Chitinophagaceae bacterium]
MKLISFLLLTIVMVSCASAQDQVPPTDFNSGIQQKNIQILDVRTAEEFKSGHIKGALQADWNNKAQFNDRTQYLNKEQKVYVYCLSGGRSAAAAGMLRGKGYSVVELKGGMMAWKAAGMPVEGANTGPQMTSTDYQKAINSNSVVLVDFGAEWCPPCKKMEPVLADLIKTNGNQFKLVKVDGGKDNDIMKQEKVEALPVFIVYKNGKEVWRHQGIVSKEDLLKAIQ